MTLYVCTLGGRGWMVVQKRSFFTKRGLVRGFVSDCAWPVSIRLIFSIFFRQKYARAIDKKRNKLRNYDLVRMHPGWAGVDGGTKKI